MSAPQSAASSRAPGATIRVLTLACCSALVAGIGEYALRLVARRVLPEPVFLNPSSIWMAPLSAFLVFLPAIAVAWGIGRLRSEGSAWLWGVGVAAFLASLDVLMLVPRLHLAALALLAAGVAAQAVLLARRWPTGFARAVRWSTGALALVAALGGARARTDGGDGRAAGGAEDADGAPNVLLLVLDTVRALELSAYGYERATSPRLEAIVREGVRFERAVATAPWTLPSHASLFTGRFQRDLSVGWSTPLDSAPPTLAEHFRAAGYVTGGFIANLRYCSREYGLARGFESYRDYAVIGSQFVGSTMLGRRAIGVYNDVRRRYVLVGRKDARRVVDEFLAWHDTEGGRPFFAFLNFFDAHEPYAPDAPYDLAFAGREPPTRQLDVGRRHSPEELQGLRDAYDGAITSLDAQLGRLFDELQRRGALDRTIVVVTADHGEEFGEHGHVSHGNGLHFPALHIPLIVRWPSGGVPQGVSVREPVSLADVPATILDLARLDRARRDGAGGDAQRVTAGSPATLAGASLAPLWRGERVPNASPILSELYWVPNQPEWYPVSGGNMRSLVRGRFHFIAGPDAREELYDIQDDPFERRNLVAEATMADTVAALRQAIARFPAEDRGGR